MNGSMAGKLYAPDLKPHLYLRIRGSTLLPEAQASQSMYSEYLTGGKCSRCATVGIFNLCMYYYATKSWFVFHNIINVLYR
jgi:hypothetical protein